MKTYAPSPHEWESAAGQARRQNCVIILGRDEVGLCAVTPDGWRFYMTDCCHAATTGTQDGIACKKCFRLVNPALGGVPE